MAKKHKKGGRKNSHLHDRFFLTLFSKPDNARDFLRAQLPEPVANAIEFDSLRLSDTAHQDEHRTKIYADLSFSVRLRSGTPAEIYILLEHKSTPEPHLFVQLLSYMVAMWREDMRQKRPYRVIIPLVFYHGRAKWKLSRSFRETFVVEDAIRPFMPELRYTLFDTAEWSDSEEERACFAENVELLAGISAFKAVFSPHRERQFSTLLRYLHTHGMFTPANNTLILVFEYLVTAWQLDETAFERLIEKSDIPKEEVMPTALEVWEERGWKRGVQEGLQQGIQQGMQQGSQQEKLAVARRMLAEGLSVAVVARVTGLSVEEIQSLSSD